MIDLKKLEQYKENNRIEAKRALGGLPYSVWETYSSFANTMGGIILLGVEESKDKSFRAVDLPDPQRLVNKFWQQLNDPRRVNVNILTKHDVRIEKVGGKRIVVIEVPRAHRTDKPVYIENDPMRGTYRRGGEGDYRCTPAEIEAMRRDAAAETEDMSLLENASISALDMEAIRAYRRIMHELRPGHAMEKLDHTAFLLALGAAGRDAAGELRPSAAGLLMFGFASAVRHIYPAFSLRFSVCKGNETHPVSGVNLQNLFYFQSSAEKAFDRAYTRSATARGVLREALVNSLVNADYTAEHAVLIEQRPDAIVFSNSGAFRVDPKAARAGGVSDARNKGLARMFMLIGAGAGIGGGIPRMFREWRKGGRPLPVISEAFFPERTVLTLPLHAKNKISPQTGLENRPIPRALARQLIAEHLTVCIGAHTAEIAAELGVSPARARRLLAEMSEEGLVISVGEGKETLWRLRERAGL